MRSAASGRYRNHSRRRRRDDSLDASGGIVNAKELVITGKTITTDTLPIVNFVRAVTGWNYTAAESP
jgi:hypothetical protein